MVDEQGYERRIFSANSEESLEGMKLAIQLDGIECLEMEEKERLQLHQRPVQYRELLSSLCNEFERPAAGSQHRVLLSSKATSTHLPEYSVVSR